jgi:predicted Zn-dependent protease with MMP-like domain
MTGQFDRWQGVSAPSLADIEAMAAESYAHLPEQFRNLCKDLVIRVDDFPSQEVAEHMKLESEFDLLGLFQGIGLSFMTEGQLTGQLPNMIWLYRRPILDYWAEHDERLGDIVTHVLVHEIGHHFGLSDDDIDAIEASVD